MIKILIMMMILGILLFLLWVLAIRPGKIEEAHKKIMREYENVYIAHRGLFCNKGREPGEHPLAPENSLEAFRLAVQHGYGIELDIQLTKDEKLVVFHDETLKRMCGIDKKLIDCSYDELRRYPLLGSGQRIPLFRDVLDIVDGRVPMIVEVKPEGDCCKTAAQLKEHMKDYKGIYCMESFHPMAVRWYRKHCPDVVRGQLSERFPKKTKLHENLFQFFHRSLCFNFLGRPHFIAYNHKHKGQKSYRLCRKLYPVYNVAWTIRSEKQLAAAKDVFSVFIFDSFIPEEEIEIG